MKKSFPKPKSKANIIKLTKEHHTEHFYHVCSLEHFIRTKYLENVKYRRDNNKPPLTMLEWCCSKEKF